MDQERKLYSSGYNPLFVEPSRPLPKEVAIVGAGTIGPDVGYYIKTALPGIRLYLVGRSEASLKKAEKRFENYAARSVEKKKLREQDAKELLGNIVYTTDYSQMKDCDLVIESATESLPIKQSIFEQIESVVRDDTIITSNTSSIPAERIFAPIERKERTSITHFFAPAWRSLPVEVVRWEEESQDTLDYLVWFFAQTGKVPLITDNVICFMLDRVFNNWCNDAAHLLSQASSVQIDHVVEEFVAAGPFFILNMANGNPLIMIENGLQMEEGEHYRPAPILASVDKWITARPGSKVEVPEEVRKVVRDRMLGILFSQCLEIVDRGIGTRSDLNYGCRIGLGFNKGPLDLMKDRGEAEVMRILDRFSKDRPGFPRPRSPFSSYLEFKRFLLVDDVDGVKVITIRRPEALNAISDEVNDEILSVLEEHAEDPAIKGFVITGYGTKAFSAGAEIGRFPQSLGNREAAQKYARDCSKLQSFMDGMNKPVVAAVNGMALGGGFEIALRCHRIVAMKGAFFQFPEITLGILPGLGGCVVPYRRWPKGAGLFHEMICLARPLSAKEASEIGMVSRVAEGYPELIRAAVDEVKHLQGRIQRIPDGKVEIPEFELPDPPVAGKQPVSREAVAITIRTIREGAAAETFQEALEIGYRGAAEIACTEAAREGITAFLEKRRPVFNK
ncbi:MAG: enoyl-CoA hydratase/isomerase family protein [Deltaproteobacteria bacterium]|nr:enoyl-CoA hydratase/isomerase family protein [Deltaproteobacteria bacterium]